MDLNKLERKFGKYAINNLSLLVIGAYVLGYVLQMLAPNALGLLFFDPYRIIHGQVWRIISWVLIPPYTISIFTLINLFFFYTLGRTLERMWGEFRYNLYILSGIAFVIVGVFIVYGVVVLTGGYGVSVFGEAGFSARLGQYVSTYYINISVILAFAMSIPDMRVMFWFFIPLKMKWLAYLEGAILFMEFVNVGNNIGRIVMIISLLNFFGFLFLTKKSKKGFSGFFNSGSFKTNSGGFRSFKTYTTGGESSGNTSQTTFRKSNVVTRHKCAICGQTEISNPNISFRFCSKCNGNYEYCETHLFTHSHVK